MADRTTKIIGTLILLFLASGIIYVTLGEQARIRIDEDQSTIYVKNADNRWVVGGREINKLMDGASNMNRYASGIQILEREDGNIVTIMRITPYIRGPIVRDTYTFDSSMDDVELFPINHDVEIFNGQGYYYKYEVRDLTYDGPTYKLDGKQTEAEFGRNIKVTWWPNYRLGWIYGSGSMYIKSEKIETDYVKFGVRLFDPPTGENFTFLFDGETTLSYNYDTGGFNDTYFNSTLGAVMLNTTAGLNGNYTSQIFDAGLNATWQNVTWYGTAVGEFPDFGGVEYQEGAADMTGNILLMHMDEGGFGENRIIVDSSGSGNNGSTINNVDGDINGKFDKGNYFNGTNYINVTSQNGMDFDINPFAVELWWKSSGPVTQRILGKYSTIDPVKYWGFYILNSQLRFYALDFAPSAISVLDNEWHHLVGLRHSNGTVELYVDGISTSPNSGAVVNLTWTAPLSIGRWGDFAQYSNATSDEIAIYNRTLTSTEILNHYIRGIARLNLSARTCDDINCLDESWTPIGDTSPQTISITNNTHFQYRFEYGTTDGAIAPELYNVTIQYAILGEPDTNLTIWNGTNYVNPHEEYITFRCSTFQASCEPENQNDDSNQPIYKVCNNGTAAGVNVSMYVNVTYTDIDLYCDDDTSYAGSTRLNITPQNIHGTVDVGSCVDIYCWANYGDPSTGGWFTPTVNITKG